MNNFTASSLLNRFSAFYTSKEEVKTAVMKGLKEQSIEFTRLGYKLSFEGTLVLRETLTMLGCDPQKTSWILTYDTSSRVGNYSCTKEKGITFRLTLLYNTYVYIYLWLGLFGPNPKEVFSQVYFKAVKIFSQKFLIFYFGWTQDADSNHHE